MSYPVVIGVACVAAGVSIFLLLVVTAIIDKRGRKKR